MIVWLLTVSILQLPFGMSLLFNLINLAIRTYVFLVYFPPGTECAPYPCAPNFTWGKPRECPSDGVLPKVNPMEIMSILFLLPMVYSLYLIYCNERSARQRFASQLLTERR